MPVGLPEGPYPAVGQDPIRRGAQTTKTALDVGGEVPRFGGDQGPLDAKVAALVGQGSRPQAAIGSVS